MAWELPKPDLAIGIPFQGGVSGDWAINLKRLIIPNNTLFITQDRGSIDYAREDITKTFLETPAKYLLFIDSDVHPDIHAVSRLMEHKFDIVAGVYRSKKHMIEHEGRRIYPPAAWKHIEDRGLQPIVSWRPGAIVSVDAVGMGLTLISRRIIEALEPPRFRWTKDFEEHPWDKYAKGIGVGEDIYFCYKVRKELGLPIYVDTSVIGEHETKGLIDETKIKQMGW